MHSFALLSMSALFFGCPKPQPKNQVFETGKIFTIMQGQTAQTADGSLKIHFDEVTADSRCPTGVQCVWAGRVDASFTLTQGSANQTVQLSSGALTKGGANSATFGGYTVKLEGMEPAKKSEAMLDQKEYKATMVVAQ